MRKYEGAWIQLRDNPNEPLVIAAHKLMHRRIYKAIIKEKDIDVVFKYLTKETGWSTKLSKQSNGGQLIIRLTFFIGLGDLWHSPTQ